MSTEPLILILCTGNICRSPMAETLMRHHLKVGKISAAVRSCGLGAPADREPHPYARATAQANNLPIDPDKRSAQVTNLDFQQAAVVLVMDSAQRHKVLNKYPQAGGKCFLFNHWSDGQDITDPLHASQEVFDLQWQQLDKACKLWVEKLLDAGILQKTNN